MNEHPDITEFVDLARGSAHSERAAEVFEHCRTCESCDTQLSAVLVLRAEGEMDAAPAPAPATGSGHKNRWLAVAAMFVAGIAVGIVGSNAVGPGGAEITADAESQPAEAAFPSEVPASQLAEALRVYDEMIGRSNLLDFELTVLAARDAKAGSWTAPEVRPGLVAFADGRYTDAAAEFEVLHTHYPYDPQIAIYLGIALFHTGERSDRVHDLLVLGLADDLRYSLHVNARTYLARLYLGRGQVDEALRLLAYTASRPIGTDAEFGVDIFERIRPILESR